MILEITPAHEEKSFNQIAEVLNNKYFLKVNNTEIELCDLEFYWNDENAEGHQDINTHHHNYTNGQLRPHGSGYDIALKNDNGYGGILIRGVINSGIPTYGPIRCADVIFKTGGDLLKPGGLSISLVERKIPKNFSIFATTRVGLVKKTYKDAHYRFLSCRADYLCEVASKTKICSDIVESDSTLKEITDKALETPMLKKGTLRN